MKKYRHFLGTLLTALFLLVGLPISVSAQLSDNGFANIDWQYNKPFGNGFAEHGSGWGMNVEGGYFVTQHLGIGLFLNYHTNHQYIDRSTMLLPGDGSLTTDQYHTLFQLPFGITTRYQFNRGGIFQPYAGLKLGAAYSNVYSDYFIYRTIDKPWGAYVSPEIGINVFPKAYGIGIHAAVYYSYMSNKTEPILTYQMEGSSNFGFRLGIAF